MPTSILTPRRAGSALLALAALLASALGAPGCVSLRPRSERAGENDAGTDPGDADVDAAIATCQQSGACTCTPAIVALGLGVVAHGARLTLTGGCFSDATAVRIGGVDQTFVVVDDTHVTIDSVLDTTPVGLSQPVVVVSSEGSSVARNTIVAHLVVSELDADSDAAGMDRHQFVEIGTGLGASVNLAEYMVVFFGGADDGVYDTTRGASLGTTAANGLYLIANSSVAGAQATIPTKTLAPTGDAHAVVIYQGTVLPAATATLGTIALPIVDALVYSTAATTNDTGLLDLCYPVAGDRLQLDEGANGGTPSSQSVRRCASTRRAGTSFGVAAPTPGSPNVCP